MKKSFTYSVLLIVMFMFSVGMSAQTNPYPDGTVIPASKNMNKKWSVNVGTSISTAGDIRSAADGIVKGNMIVNGNYVAVNTGRGDRVKSGGRLEIFGNLTAESQIIVEEGAVLIVHGNFNNKGSGSTQLAGDVIVKGNVNFKGVTVPTSGKLVIGGDVRIHNAGGSYSGSVYALDPAAKMNIAKWGPITKEEVGDVDEFINDPDNSDIIDLASEVGLVSAVDAPSNFTYKNLSGSNVDLEWTLNASKDSVIITWSVDDLSDRAVKGTNYEVGDKLSGESLVVYKGIATNWSYTGLTPGVTSNFRIWSFTSDKKEYSSAVNLEVKALSSNTIFYDGFEGTTSGEGAGSWNNWPGQNSRGTLSGDKWIIGGDETFMGAKAKYISNQNSEANYNHTPLWYYRNAQYFTDTRLTVSGIDTKYKSVELSFYWKCIGEPTRDEGSVHVNETWFDDFTGQEDWFERTIDITDAVNNGSVSIEFRFLTNHLGGENPGFCIDEVRVVGSEVARARDFSGTADSSEEVALSWKKSVDNDDVMIAYSSFGSIGRPETGKDYAIGDYLNGGGEVIYIGSVDNFVHTGNFSGELHYSLWSQKLGAFSSAKTITVRMPVVLPFTEDFERGVDQWAFGKGANEWVQGAATANSGAKSAYISNDQGVTAGYEIEDAAETFLELDVDLRGYKTAEISFMWKCGGSYNSRFGNSMGAFGEFYVDGIRRSRGAAYHSKPTEWQSTTIEFEKEDLNKVSKIALKWKNLQNYIFWEDDFINQPPGFCIDDIYITGTIEEPKSFTASNLNDVFNDLAWSSNTFGDDVLIAWSEGSIGEPKEGVTYDVGDDIPDGGLVLYTGSLAEFKHEPLKYNTLYNYKIWSVRNTIYSTGILASANTPAKVIVLQENWDDDSGLSWDLRSNNNTNKWVTNKSASIDGNTSKFAFISNNNQNAQFSRTTTSASLNVNVNLDELHTANVNFDWVSRGDTNDYGELYINGTRISATKEFRGETTWQVKSISLDDYCSKGLGDIVLSFKWVNNRSNPQNAPGFCVDNIEIGGIYAPTSLINNAQRLSSTVSSLANTEANAVEVFQFDLTDKTSSYNDITRIQQLVVSKGASDNTVSDWDDAIEGALLTGAGITAPGLVGVVTSGGITFTGTDIVTLSNQDQAVPYKLKVWLSKDLKDFNIADGDAFEFVVKSNNIVTGLGDDFIADQEVSSGKVTIDVEATELQFITQPSSHATIDRVLAVAPSVAATDEHGNVDADFVSSIALSNASGIGMTNEAIKASDGVVLFNQLTFTQTGTANLIATSGALVSEESNDVNISNFCHPVHSSSNRYITNVIVNTLNNTSGNDGSYGDYLNLETILAKGETIDVTIGGYNGSGRAYAYVWIDFYGSGESGETQNDFFNSSIGERFIIGSTTKTGVVAISGTINVPADVKSGNKRMRIQLVGESSSNTACGSGSSKGESEDYIVNIASDGWTGVSPVWSIPQNWSKGVVPTVGEDVFIPTTPSKGDFFPLITDEANMRNLEISENASLTIKPGAAVTIAGDAVINGDLTVQNTNAEPASLIIDGFVIGDTNVEWTYDNLRWWFVGHSVSNPTIPNYNQMLAVSNNYVLYDYREPAKLIKISKSKFDLAAQNELKGYQLKVRYSGALVAQKGVLNNAPDYTRPLLSEWQIVSNPYASYYQLPTNVSGGDFENTTGTIYAVVATSNQDKMFHQFNAKSGIGSPVEFNGILAPSQAFYLKTAPGMSGKTVTMRASNRVHDTSKSSLKSASVSRKDILRIQLSNSQIVDEAVVALMNEGNMAYTDLDSEQRFLSTKTISYVYSLIEDNQAVINVLPRRIYGHQVQLGINAREGDHVMKIDGVDKFPNTYELVLEDKALDEFTKMEADTEYAFTTEAGVFDNRFVLHFNEVEVPVIVDDPADPDEDATPEAVVDPDDESGSGEEIILDPNDIDDKNYQNGTNTPTKVNVPTDINDGAKTNDAAVTVAILDKTTLQVRCNWSIVEKTVSIYTMTGQQVYSNTFKGKELTDIVGLPTGVYIVKVVGENNSFEQKVLVD